ncbi:recombinase family protein [Streptomyces sp. NPDC046909]|uniref:recombinase family protein n=1 Tax=Streptomyces sp. NPDC046909 TaxID=3155617 RepID=UPI0033FF08FD
MDRYGIYERLSRVTEASTSIERQDETCRAEVRRRGGRVAGVWTDEGVSGAKPPLERPGMKELLDHLSGMDAVMVWKIDRIARSFLGFAEIVTALDAHGVALISATEPVDMSGPTGRAMAQMIAVFAELEREMIKARVADSMRRARDENRFHGGRVPYGLTVADHPSGKGRVLVRDQHGMDVLREMAAWIIVEELNPTQVARRLNDRGELTSRQRGAVLKGAERAREARWRAKAVVEVVASPLMLGYRPLPGGGVQCNEEGLPVVVWDPVVTRDEWDAIVSMLESQRSGPRRREPRASHWLSGVVRCSVCARTMKQHTPTTGTAKFACAGERSERTEGKHTLYVRRDGLADWVREVFPQEFGHLHEVDRRWVSGNDAQRELSDARAAIKRLRDDRDAGLFEDDEDDFRERMGRLLERRKALAGVPDVAPHWEQTPTGRTLADAWAEKSDEERGALLREYGLAVWVEPAASRSRTLPVGDRLSIGPADPEAETAAMVARDEGIPPRHVPAAKDGVV